MLNKTEKEIMKNWQGNISKPIVSVCTITYNHEKYIHEAIDSFLMQETDFPFEIIIGEDCSIDTTKKIVEEYIQKYPNIIRLITSDNNVGMQENGKRTIEACLGKYIAICEGDDFWTDKNKLQIQKDFLYNNFEYVICYTDCQPFNENGLMNIDFGGARRDLTTDELQKATPIYTLTVMFKNVIKEFPQEYLFSKYGDVFIWSMLGEYGKGKYLPQIKPSAYRVHQGGLYSMISKEKKIDMAFHTYFALFIYHNSKNNKVIANHYKMEILWLFLKNDLKSFLFFIFKKIKNRLQREIK
ncbi:MAG: glycosyltransferase [Sulfurimonas sp.]|uniref:glycosyltransferase family 2 protein n=1 Tax=Sulfurimonas sp. TaxID=2022749 RepID=UPI00262CFE3C|nr:glycosyltransferase [Sulfurimonas sp.]MDD5371922.1 glycosyltransferase [Sulfurimonas sp.]